jgi:hypothetical protein
MRRCSTSAPSPRLLSSDRATVNSQKSQFPKVTMSKRSFLLLVAVIGFGVTLQPHEAEAATAGQFCTEAGATSMSDDQRYLLGCVRVGESKTLMWVSLGKHNLPNAPSASAYGANAEWYECQNDNQCVIVAGSCGVEWAVYKEFVDQSRNNPPRPDESCTKPREHHPANTVAKCKNNKCALSLSGLYEGGTPMPSK